MKIIILLIFFSLISKNLTAYQEISIQKDNSLMNYEDILNSISSSVAKEDIRELIDKNIYNINFSLYSFTATAENGLQIIEQILPFFQPEYTVTMNVIPELDIKRDIPIILNSVNYEDTYNGEFTQRRAVIYTLNFTAKTYLYGPMSNQGIIKEVQADLGADTDPKLSREERIVIKTNPTSADADDDFGFTTTITSFSDSKRYNPVSDTDE